MGKVMARKGKMKHVRMGQEEGREVRGWGEEQGIQEMGKERQGGKKRQGKRER